MRKCGGNATDGCLGAAVRVNFDGFGYNFRAWPPTYVTDLDRSQENLRRRMKLHRGADTNCENQARKPTTDENGQAAYTLCLLLAAQQSVVIIHWLSLHQ